MFDSEEPLPLTLTMSPLSPMLTHLRSPLDMPHMTTFLTMVSAPAARPSSMITASVAATFVDMGAELAGKARQ